MTVLSSHRSFFLVIGFVAFRRPKQGASQHDADALVHLDVAGIVEGLCFSATTY